MKFSTTKTDIQVSLQKLSKIIMEKLYGDDLEIFKNMLSNVVIIPNNNFVSY